MNTKGVSYPKRGGKGTSRNALSDNPNYCGDAVTYAGLHSRLKRARGRASSWMCADCSNPAAQWSYDKADPNEKFGTTSVHSNVQRPYSLDFDHYVPRCHRCHRAVEGGSFQPREAHPNHKLTTADVEEIYALRDLGESLYSIARRYDVNHTAIWKVLKKR